MKYVYMTNGTCSQAITFKLDKDVVSDISFFGGCNGNLKALGILLEGATVDYIYGRLKGNTCGMRPTSCADQLATAVKAAYDGELEPLEEEE